MPESVQETVRTHLSVAGLGLRWASMTAAIADYTKAIALNHHRHDEQRHA